ncbi:MAG: BMP family ABC transporter substrate-binding protein, partial [Candidatus Kariarchaeaceae archaeon]
DVTNLAPQFPDVNFLLVGILELDVADNVSGIHYLTSEGGYLQGIIAGMMTQNNKIGFIGGIDIPDIIAIYNAMILGAMSVNPDLEIDDFSDVYLGTFADPALAKEAALTLNDAGADVIFSSCDLGVIGVAEAAIERGFYVLVAGTPEVNDLAPELVLSADPSFVHYDTKYWETEYLKQKAGIFGNQKFAVGLSTGHASFEDVLFIFDSLPNEIATLVQGIGNDIKDHVIYVPLLTQKGGAEQYLAENGLPPYEFP